ncbi:MAG TPA: HAD family hydrolase [Phycisphaerales bacterium]|nr:HAD family hydrolase [Phycisphaerales bacterium]
MGIRAVIFDLDGTITEPYFDFDAIREEIGLPRNGGPILEAMRDMDEAQRRSAEAVLHRHEQLALEQSRLNPGARETLEALRRADIRIGILTRNIRQNALEIARRHNLFFDGVVGREDGPVKPDAFGVRWFCEQFDIPPAEAMVVGDYPFDIQCAKAAGATAVLLANQPKAAEFAKYADFTIDRIDQILGIIQNGKEHRAACR